jgi:hypothetical protein
MTSEERARKVFVDVFQARRERLIEEAEHPLGMVDLAAPDWIHPDDEGVLPPGTAKARFLTACLYLMRKGLIERAGQSYALSDLGTEACQDLPLLDRCLSDAVDRFAPNVSIGTAHAPVQIGNGNVQNTTYSTILQSLVETIERAPGVPPETKRTWTTTLRELAAHPLTQTVVQTAATVASAVTGRP